MSHLATAAVSTPRRPFATMPAAERAVAACPADRIAAGLRLVRDSLPLTRRVLQAGESVYEAGDRFQCLHIVHAGVFKLVNGSSDGREQVVGLQFKGDWLGFDGIASGRHAGGAIAMDTSEVWSVRYDDLLRVSMQQPELMRLMHSAMSREIARDRSALLSICTLPADARVAEFLQQWTSSLADRGLRTDQITLRMTRAEIGNYLGMKLETVSRALSRLAREGYIEFCGTGRRDIRIPDVEALGRAAGLRAATLQ